MVAEMGLILAHSYPAAVAGEDYEIRDDSNGNGPYIAHWDEAALGPPPAETQLRAAWLPAAKAQKRDELVLAADAAYSAVFTRDGAYVELEKDYIMWRKMFGLALAPLQTSQVTQAQAVIEKLQARLAAVNQIVQGPNETVEDAVARVRAMTW